MTPKEKATELTNKSWKIEWENTPGQNSWSTAKKHALIAVDEVMNAQTLVYGMGDFNGVVFDKYWQEVKQEIEKL